MTIFFAPSEGVRLAAEVRDGADPTVLFLPGFNSNMRGRKAETIDRLCAERGQRFVRFDYQGHGESSGTLAEGHLGLWLGDARGVIERFVPRSMVLVGASMGAWIMFLLAREFGPRVRGLVGIGAGVDFTARALERLDDEQRQAFERDGIAWRPSRYGDGPYPLTRAMVHEGNQRLVLGTGLELDVPVRLFHGLRDPDLDWRHAIAIVEGITGKNIRLTLIAEGDHRLSEPQDLEAISTAISEVLDKSPDQS